MKILKRKQVEEKLCISRTTIYAKIKPSTRRPGDYDPSFPRPIRLGGKGVGWIESELDAWIEKQAALRD
jgi:prophage regulatory protein